MVVPRSAHPPASTKPERHKSCVRDEQRATHWQCRDRNLDLGAPVVMGVLNVTPDSFSDGGRFAERDVGAACTRAA